MADIQVIATHGVAVNIMCVRPACFCVYFSRTGSKKTVGVVGVAKTVLLKDSTNHIRF